MKILLIVTLCVISIGAYPQSENETIEFLNSKLTVCHSFFPRPDGSKAPTNWKISKDKRDGIDVVVIELHADVHISTNLVYPVNIIDVVESRAPNGNLNIRIVDGKGAVLNTDASTGEGVWLTEVNLVLNCEDSEIRRIIKALKHLFEMNGCLKWIIVGMFWSKIVEFYLYPNQRLTAD